MEFSQGGESNRNGRWLEELVRQEARSLKIPVLPYVQDGDNEHLFSPIRLIERVPYKSIYGTEATSEFVLQCYERRARIECRVQETSGSVDEKFPYLVDNAKRQMPEREIVFLLHGNGARWQAISWLKAACKEIQDKTVHVFNISECRAWMKSLKMDATPRR